MDCYGQLPLENRFGVPRYNRFSETPPTINTSSNLIDSPSSSIIKPNSESINPFINHQRSHSPIRYSHHPYSTPYRMSPSLSSLPPPPPQPPPTTPLNYYPYNYDSNCSRSYLPRPINSYSPSIESYKDPLDKYNGCHNPPSGSIEEYYKNTHYNYQQSFNNYGKLSVPKNPYFNHHLGLPPHHPSYLSPQRVYHPSARNEFYDPIAGLHQAVRNGFKDNIGLSNTYHNIYNYSPPPISNQIKKPHFTHPYDHHPNYFPHSYSNFSPYDAKRSNFDYYRGHHPFLNSYPSDYPNPNTAQYHLYQQQQQQQHHQQLLANKHHLEQQQSLYHNSYPNSMTLDGQNVNPQLKSPHSPKLSEFNKRKTSEAIHDDRLSDLIKEELRPISSGLDTNQIRNDEDIKNHSISSEDVPLEISKNNNDKIEQRAESSISEANTVNDLNSETTAASSPLTSVSSYTDSGISGCSNNIDGSSTSDGGSIEDKTDENNINHINSNNIEGEVNEKAVEINAKLNNENYSNGEEKSKISKVLLTEESDSNTNTKDQSEPSNNPSKESKMNNEKNNQLGQNTKSYSDHCPDNRIYMEQKTKNERPLQMSSNQNYLRHLQSISSRDNLGRYQNDSNIPSQYIQGNSLQSEYHKPHLTGSNWSSYHHYHNQSRLKTQSINRTDNSQNNKNNNNKNLNKNNNNKVNTSSINICKSRVLECDFIPSKKSRKKLDFDNYSIDSSELREEIKDIKPLPAFQQAFGSTEIGRFSEIFQNNSPDSLYNRCSSTPYDYNSIENYNNYPWHETGDSLESTPYSNYNRSSSSSIYSNYAENFDNIESSKENYFNSFN